VKPLAPVARFERAVGELDPAFPDDRLDDENAEHQLRHWLDGPDEPMPWTREHGVLPLAPFPRAGARTRHPLRRT
jgi:hypothetical protein